MATVTLNESAPAESPRTKRWRELCAEFCSCHQQPLNIALHALTTPLCLVALLGLLAQWSIAASASVVVVYLGLLAAFVPGRIWAATAVASALLLGAALLIPLGWVAAAGLFILGYTLQEVAHWLTGEPTLQSSYMQSQTWLGRLIEHSLLLLPLVLVSIVRMEGTPLSVFVPRNRVLSTHLANAAADQLECIRQFVLEQEIPESTTAHWWQDELTGTPAEAFATLAGRDEIQTMFRDAHGPGHAVELLHEMNEIYVGAPVNSLSSDKVFYTAHIDGPWALYPCATVYRAMLAINANDIVHTHFPFGGRDQQHPLTKTLSTGDLVAFDYNREPHYITSDARPQPERRISLKLHYLVYPQKLSAYGRLLGRLSCWYNTRARHLFLNTISPTGTIARLKAWGILAATWGFEFVVTRIGWANLAWFLCLLAISLMFAQPVILLAGTSFVHYLIYLGTYADRRNVSFPRFKRNTIFFKSLAMAQLVGWSLYFFDAGWLSMSLILAGFGLAGWASAVLGIDRTYFSEELGHCAPARTRRFPYGVISHPMILGAIVGLIGFGLSPGLQSRFPWLVPLHIVFYLLILVQESLDLHRVPAAPDGEEGSMAVPAPAA